MASGNRSDKVKSHDAAGAPQDVAACPDRGVTGASYIASLESEIVALLERNGSLIGQSVQLRERLASCEIAKQEWELFFDHAPDMLCVVGPDGRLKRINRAFEVAVGYTCDEYIRLPLEAVVHPDDEERVKQHIGRNLSGEDSLEFEMRMKCRYSDEYRWYSWTSPGHAAGSGNFLAVVRDVTARKLTESALIHRAFHDPLTGLSNRAYFDEGLEEAFSRASRIAHYSVALFMIDLDGFKAINDTHGHASGDVVLKTIGERLMKRVRRGDIICRLGGDEFALIVEGIAPLPVGLLAQNIIDEIRKPIEIGEIEVAVGCSIGISQYPSTASVVTELVQQADVAMYHVKRNGKNAYECFSPS
jgi:diguanylate cyclase (GGDEF)-like protein/PAS domain S-box-containing protein